MENYDIFTFRDFYEWDMLADKQLKEAEFYFNATDIALEAIMNVGRRSNVV